jgi:nucleoside-diphosphate-sugar epimerase
LRILITGAAGFIGSALTSKLISLNNQILGIDNFDETLNTSKERRNVFRSFEGNDNLILIEGDLNSLDLFDLVSGVDVIIHCAATPGLLPSWTHLDKYLRNNVESTHAIASAAAQSNVSQFILLSTSSVYGRVATCDENGPVDPSSPYGITKFSSELIARNLLEESGVDLIALRLFSIFGPGQRADMGIRKFIDSYLFLDSVNVTGDGSHKRTFTYIDDLVNLISGLLETKDVSGTYNIAGKEQIQILNLLDHLEDLTSRKIQRNFISPRRGDQLETLGDTSKAEQVLGWNPKTEFLTGLQEQLKWQRSLRE